MKIFYFLIFSLLVQLTFSQQSAITGKIIEESTGKSLPGATIRIKDTKLSMTSDSEGNFIFRNVKAGKYDLEFSAFTFETKIITEVEVINNETTNLTVSLAEKSNALEEVVIKTVRAKTESVQSLLTMQKNSIRVSDGISAESIKRTPDKSAADVLKRISGASIQDNKFVIIRGLNDRYNTTYLNGAPLPSTEPDRKAFSFDIFPANMLDNLVIYKTASPDIPGEFAGGVVEINTKSTPDKNFQVLSVGGGYNTFTTGKKQLYATGGSYSLPSSFPTIQELKDLQQSKNNTENNILQIANIAKNSASDWSLSSKNFSPNLKIQYSIGRNFKLDGGETVGVIFSLTHNKTNLYSETNRRTYETPGALITNQLDKNYNVQSLTAGIANFSLRINEHNNFSFKNLYSAIYDSKIMDRNGSLNQESDPLYINTTSRLFTSNKIYSGQLIGEHYLTKSKIKINWNGAFSNVNRVIPSERRNSYIYTKFDDGTVSQPKAEFSTNAVGGDYPGSIYTSDCKESIFSSKIDLNKKIKFNEMYSVDVKIGAITQSRFRLFDARQLGYIPFNGTVGNVSYGIGPNTLSPTISFLPDATIFNASNMGILGPKLSGLTLFDGSKGNDSYTASSHLNAGYLLLDNTFNKFRLVWGARIENYSQKLNSKSDAGVPIIVDDSRLDVLPSVNLIYSVSKKQNIRLSASKTLNRPEFREMAPFLFYDSATKQNTSGPGKDDPKLTIADVLNADLRYEIFPGKGQLFSFSLFYKEFKNPIELQALANNSNQYKNAKSGINKGVEIEYRTLLSSMFGTENSKILDDITFFTNCAVIRSKVDISNFVTSTELTDIPMQGQSPYVFNTGIQYTNKEKAISFTANFNKIGSRIAIHGNQTPGGSTPAYWEKSRAFLDLQASKSFLDKKIDIIFNVQNVLAQDLDFYQNNYELTDPSKIKGIKALANSIFTGNSQNINGYNSKTDDIVWKTKFGPTFVLAIEYHF